MLGIALLLMVAVLFVGVEVKGAHRWVSLIGISIQPSEFMKPAFVIMCAWLFAEKARNPDIPGNLLAMMLLGIVVALLVTLIYLAARYEASVAQTAVERDVADALSDIRSAMTRNVQELQALQSGRPDRERWLEDAERLLRGNFDGGATRLVDTLGSQNDDRALLVVHRR